MENVVRHDVQTGIVASEGVNATVDSGRNVNRSRADIFRRIRWATTRRPRIFTVGTNFLPCTRVPFYILSRRSSSELTVFFLISRKPFVTRDIVITLWILVTCVRLTGNCRCIVQILPHDYSYGLTAQWIRCPPIVRFHSRRRHRETAGIAFFFRTRARDVRIYLRSQRGGRAR